MRLNLKEMEMNSTVEHVDVLVENMEERMTATGRPYVFLTLRDGYNPASFHMYLWERTVKELQKTIQIGDVARLKLHKKKYKDGEGYDIRNIIKAPEEEVNPDDFARVSSKDIRKMYEEAKAMVSEETNYGKILHYIYNQYETQLLHGASGKTVHHDYIGGLLEHLLGVGKICDAICHIYPNLDRDMMVTGGLLHDIGKIYELETSPVGMVSYTPAGVQLGHAVLGIKIIMLASLKLGLYQTRERKMLEALIASHHGDLDKGALTVPSFEEAAMLHEADMIDSRHGIFTKAYEGMEQGELSTGKHPFLKVAVYRP